MKAILRRKGDVKLFRIKYKKFQSNKGAHDHVIEYLWFVRVFSKDASNPEIGLFEDIEL
jgi:hypothetical protein